MRGVIRRAVDPSTAERIATGRGQRVLLRSGVVAAAILLLVGLIRWVTDGVPATRFEPGGVWRGVLVGDPVGWIGLGLIVLAATPIVRLVGLMVSYAHQGRLFLAACAFLVLALIAVGIGMGGR